MEIIDDELMEIDAVAIDEELEEDLELENGEVNETLSFCQLIVISCVLPHNITFMCRVDIQFVYCAKPVVPTV